MREGEWDNGGTVVGSVVRGERARCLREVVERRGGCGGVGVSWRFSLGEREAGGKGKRDVRPLWGWLWACCEDWEFEDGD